MALDAIRIAIFIIGYFIVGASLTPLIRNDNWMFRIFEYPRAQKLFINIALLIAFPFVAEWERIHDVFFMAVLVLNSLYLFYQIFPYTVVARSQMTRSTNKSEGRSLRLLVCNVYQDNRRYSDCLRRIDAEDPDIIILVETDKQWADHLAPLEDRYPYCVLNPLENTYGMVLYSRLELVNPIVKHLVESDIPSIHTAVKLSSGEQFYLYCLHPQPPVPQENPRSTERDAELLMIAKEAKSRKMPVIVAGDLNDVAWSYTTELFMKISGLLDPRRGRGFYNTFHADHWYLRWPLDHVFCSSHFQLCDLRTLPHIGSDHFPILVELCLNTEEQNKNEENKLSADADERREAEEKIARA